LNPFVAVSGLSGHRVGTLFVGPQKQDIGLAWSGGADSLKRAGRRQGNRTPHRLPGQGPCHDDTSKKRLCLTGSCSTKAGTRHAVSVFGLFQWHGQPGRVIHGQDTHATFGPVTYFNNITRSKPVEQSNQRVLRWSTCGPGQRRSGSRDCDRKPG